MEYRGHAIPYSRNFLLYWICRGLDKNFYVQDIRLNVFTPQLDALTIQTGAGDAS